MVLQILDIIHLHLHHLVLLLILMDIAQNILLHNRDNLLHLHLQDHKENIDVNHLLIIHHVKENLSLLLLHKNMVVVEEMNMVDNLNNLNLNLNLNNLNHLLDLVDLGLVIIEDYRRRHRHHQRHYHYHLLVLVLVLVLEEIGKEEEVGNLVKLLVLLDLDLGIILHLRLRLLRLEEIGRGRGKGKGNIREKEKENVSEIGKEREIGKEKEKEMGIMVEVHHYNLLLPFLLHQGEMRENSLNMFLGLVLDRDREDLLYHHHHPNNKGLDLVELEGRIHLVWVQVWVRRCL